MQFFIKGLDGTDSEAMNRRLVVREAHLALGNKLEASGNRWYGAALLDDDGNLIGSVAIMDFPSEKELQEWLDTEPYVVGKVWKTIEVHKCNVKNPWKFNRPKEFFDSRKKKNNA